jgi:hypothetical protein
LPKVHRAAGEGRKTGAKYYAGIGQLKIGHDTIGDQLLNPVNQRRDQPFSQPGRHDPGCTLASTSG